MSRRALIATVVLALAVGGVVVASSHSGASGTDEPSVRITPSSPTNPGAGDPGPAVPDVGGY